MDKENWLGNVKKRSTLIRDYMQERTYDDSIGWKQRIEVLLSNPYETRSSGLLISGPSGCGKHTLAALAVQALSELEYSIIFLNGHLITEEAENSSQMVERINAVLDDAYDEETSLCIVLDEIDNSAPMYDVLSFLGQCTCDYWLNREEFPELFLILIQEQLLMLPSLLKERMHVCRLDPPDKNRRKQFLDTAAKDLVHYISIDKVIEETEGFSYGAIREFVAELGLLVDAYEQAIPIDDISVLAGKYKVPPGKNDLLSQLVGEVKQVGESFIRALTEMASTAAQAAAAAASQTSSARVNIQEADIAAQTQAQQNEEDYLTSETERINKMPMKQLAYDLFGEDGTADILQN